VTARPTRSVSDRRGTRRGGRSVSVSSSTNLSAWGLANAGTRTAEDAPDYYRATELEAAGGRVIEFGPADWKAQAA